MSRKHLPKHLVGPGSCDFLGESHKTAAIRLRPTNVSQTFGKKLSRGNRNRTDVLPTPWAYTTPILYPVSVFYPHAYTLPLCYGPTQCSAPTKFFTPCVYHKDTSCFLIRSLIRKQCRTLPPLLHPVWLRVYHIHIMVG